MRICGNSVARRTFSPPAPIPEVRKADDKTATALDSFRQNDSRTQLLSTRFMFQSEKCAARESQ